jgi:glycerol-3-phosphate acyltransferase PlsY
MFSEDMYTVALSLIDAYLIGSIPIGYIIAQRFGISDIRQHGSGNIGATNVARVLGYRFFFLIFILDAGKAFCYMTLLRHYLISDMLLLWSAALLLIGNRWSCFIHFRGGKGVATAFGILLALQPLLLMVLAGVWLAIFIMTQTVGIASVFTVITAPIWCVAMRLSSTDFLLFVLFTTAWIIATHRDNIRRALSELF